VLLRLILTAEDRGLESLALAHRAMTAVLSYHNGADAELLRRIRDRFGFDAVGTVLHEMLTDDPADPLAVAARHRVKQRTATNVRKMATPGAGHFRSLPREEQDEILTSAVFEEIARCLGGRRTLAELLDATMEALPPGAPPDARASSWDYIAWRAAQRVVREHTRDLPSGTEPDIDVPDVAGARPDEVGILRTSWPG